MPNETPRFQVNGLFEVPAENWNECLEKIKNCGLKAISINIYEIKILKDDKNAK